jgi:hypothetical protein
MHSEQVRAKIQAANLIVRLQQCADGDVELSSVQLGAINSLLDRSVPKLQQIQHIGDPDNPIGIAHSIPAEAKRLVESITTRAVASGIAPPVQD